MKPDSIEEYILTLAKMATIIQLLEEEQDRVMRTGILNIDETEMAESIKWNCKKLMTSLGDQVKMVGERTEKTWDETLQDLKEVLNGHQSGSDKNNQG